MTDSEETLRLYEKVVESLPGFDLKGKASRYTSLNGHMFSFITKEGGLALRLSDEDRDAFNAKHKTGPVMQHSAVMRGYVHVSLAQLKRTAAIKKLFAMSIAYIESLKPKPTTKKKKAAKKATKKKAAPKKKAAKKIAKKPAAKKKAAKRNTKKPR